MNMEKSSLIEGSKYWEQRFHHFMMEQVELSVAGDPDITPDEVKISYLISKLAVLMVSLEHLTKRIDDIEE
ncbi:hypothetical protein [Pseudoteredinibacter isoporae]|uniref:hypothetical protein n=1 Tax=Pseudoteredinibacter isoporae TaxID=570281 RepID=UPI003340819A